MLFVPGENFLAAAAERDPNLFDEAFAQKVIITTPSTMVALAKSVAYGWRQEQSAKNAQEIAELGRELYRRMAVMVDHMGKVGDCIGKTVTSYNGWSARSKAASCRRRASSRNWARATPASTSPRRRRSKPRHVCRRRRNSSN